MTTKLSRQRPIHHDNDWYLTLKDPVKSNVVDDIDRAEAEDALRKAGLAMRPSIMVVADVNMLVVLV